MAVRPQTKNEESEKWLQDSQNGAIINSTHSVRKETTEHQSVLDETGSDIGTGTGYFEIISEPPEEIIHDSVWPQMIACISALSFHFPVGAVFGISAILIPQLEGPDSDIKVTLEDTSWIASLVVLVVPFAALLAGYLVDKIGRLNTIKVGAIPYILGWVLIATAQNLSTILAGRLLTGFALALGPSPIAVYITEIAQPRLRGALICAGYTTTSVAMVVIYAQGAFLHWRTVAWLAISYCLLPILVMSLWSPESPVWLISKGRNKEALKSLTYLSRRDKKVGVAEQQLAELVREHNSKKILTTQQDSSLSTLLRGLMKPNGYKPLVILLFLFFFQQFSGIYVAIFYAVSFFQDVGATIDPYLSTVAIGVVRIVMGLLTSYLLQHFGCRPLCMFSGFGMALVMFICGYINKEVSEGNMEKNFIPVICILIYMTLGVTGLMTIPWMMMAELYPIEIRGMAQGLTNSLAHIIMFTVLKMYPFLTSSLGGVYAVHWLFASTSLSSVVFIFLFLPETHNKLLSDIQDYFLHNTVYILSRDKPIEVKPQLKSGIEMMKIIEPIKDGV